MPDIFVQKEDSFGYVKFDTLYKALLRPFFDAVLHKHSLTSDLMLDPTLIDLEPSEISTPGEVTTIVKAVQEDRFKLRPNEHDTSIGSELFAKVRGEIELNVAEDFRLPSYIQRDNQPLT